MPSGPSRPQRMEPMPDEVLTIKEVAALLKLVEKTALQLNAAPGPAERERLNRNKEELRTMVLPASEFSAVAKACLLKSNIGWATALAAG